MASLKLICGRCQMKALKKTLIDLDTFMNDPHLLCSPYTSLSDVSEEIFETFVDAINGKRVVVTADN